MARLHPTFVEELRASDPPPTSPASPNKKGSAREAAEEATPAMESESKLAETPIGDVEDHSDDGERKKVTLLRELVEAQDPDSKEVDDLMLRRFLRARDQDVNKAAAMFLKYLNWRKTAVPNGFIAEEEVDTELAQKKFCIQGLDKAGRPIGVVFAARHFSSNRDMHVFKNFCVYVLDKLCASIPSGQEKFIGILDLKGWGYSNCDIRGYLAVLDIMQNCYPERLGKAYLVHVPYLFMKAWKVIYPFIDNNTRKKIVFVEDKNLKDTLLEEIDESQIPDIYGGKLTLVQ